MSECGATSTSSVEYLSTRRYAGGDLRCCSREQLVQRRGVKMEGGGRTEKELKVVGILFDIEARFGWRRCKAATDGRGRHREVDDRCRK